MNKKKYSRVDFLYEIPDDLIAQYPSKKRDESRLFIIEKSTGNFHHTVFNKITEYLKKDDVLVFNNAKVRHARMFYRRKTGARIEIILEHMISENKWYAFSNRTKRLNPGEILTAEKNPDIQIQILRRTGDCMEIESNISLTDELLIDAGEIPLPPYIRRKPEKADTERYQTVYARESGAVAAPTAGLHFTDDLLRKIRSLGVEIIELTLFVSWGTFQPVRWNDLGDNTMHAEKYILPVLSVEKINRARKNNRRIIAVGTTTVRVLETTFLHGKNEAGEGETDIFIYPPKKIESIDGLVTNFHTPGSTLLMLVASFAGYDTIMKAYKEAVEMKYRFFSYGDAMMII